MTKEHKCKYWKPRNERAKACCDNCLALMKKGKELKYLYELEVKKD